MTAKRDLTRDDIISMEAFAETRTERRRELLPKKKLRRIALGPYATCYFESYETMWLQIHEMLLIEKGGEPQIADELEAYNPLVPKGAELVATVMFEIDDPDRRAKVLLTLGGVDERIFIQVGDEKLYAVPEQDVERTTPDGKISSVLFLHFPFTPSAVAAFASGDAPCMIGCDHVNYGHMAVLSDESRKELSSDL